MEWEREQGVDGCGVEVGVGTCWLVLGPGGRCAHIY